MKQCDGTIHCVNDVEYYPVSKLGLPDYSTYLCVECAVRMIESQSILDLVPMSEPPTRQQLLYLIYASLQVSCHDRAYTDRRSARIRSLAKRHIARMMDGGTIDKLLPPSDSVNSGDSDVDVDALTHILGRL